MKLLLRLIVIGTLAGCASQTQPSGGPKDTLPPLLEDSSPETGATNYTGSQIELTFSEPIQLNKPKEEIVISPAIEDVEFITRKNKVILRFPAPLLQNTTYSLNFREAVQDVTERNPSPNLKLAFSTGAYIDSLSITGTVYDLLTNRPIKDITVALFPKNDTFSIFKHKAQLFAKANEAGVFTIENLKPETFHVYAFLDKNKNLIVDQRSEKYGFLSSTLALKKSEKNVNIPLVSIDSRKIKLISARPQQNYFYIKANKPIRHARVSIKGQKPVYIRGEDKESVKLYQSFPVKDSLLANVIISDSLDQRIDTTLYIKFNAPEKKFQLEKFTSKISEAVILEKDRTLTAEISFNKPLRSINYDSILFRIDSANVVRFTPADLSLDSQRMVIRLSKQLPPGQPAQTPTFQKLTKTSQGTKELSLGKGALISIDTDSSAAQKQRPSSYKEEDLATLLVETDTKATNFFIEVLNANKTVVRTSSNKTKADFHDLIPGEYTLRLILDRNKNGTWDIGNYEKKQEPELVYFYYDEKGSQKFNLKANWEYGPLLISDKFRVDTSGIKTSKSPQTSGKLP